MFNSLFWPDEFDSDTPSVTFGPGFVLYLKTLIEVGVTVRARQDWSAFTLNRNHRTVEFVRRGRLGNDQPESWEVRLMSGRNCVSLGTAFGIRDHACVVTAGIERIETTTAMWLNGESVGSLVREVEFWDKSNPIGPLRPPAADTPFAK